MVMDELLRVDEYNYITQTALADVVPQIELIVHSSLLLRKYMNVCKGDKGDSSKIARIQHEKSNNNKKHR